MTPYARARALIDAAHDADPVRNAAGRAAELDYADAMEEWTLKLVPDAPQLLRLAARCQHLERWRLPRAEYPMNKPGYYRWRIALYKLQADRAREVLLEAGLQPEEAEDAALWVGKVDAKTNPGTQTLEDAAILVFLQHHIEDFAAQHSDYPPEKFVDILRKSWRKLSPHGREAALTIDLHPDIAALVQAAIE